MRASKTGERLPTSVHIAYALGAIASATKSVPVSTFLMLYYNQVVGLPALIVSAVLMASLIADAFFDPLIGQLSDDHRSRWGRRLPFMYVAALPVSALFILLWNPPLDWPQWAQATFLAVCLVGLRFFDTFFDLPQIALIPEITADYDARTRLFTVRYLCEAVAGVMISALAYNVFMKESPDGSGGLLASDGYPAFALFAGGLILVTALASTIVLHGSIALPGPQPAPTRTARARLAELLETLNSRPFITLVLAAILISIGSGVGSSLSMYWLIYYYRFNQAQITLLFLPLVLGLLATSLTPAISRGLGKRGAIILFCWAYFAAAATPLLVRAIDLAPTESYGLLALVAFQSIVGTATMTMVLITLSSMVADLAEEAEARTGRRSEGLLLAGISFIRKATQGFGALGAGLILSVVDFPTGAGRGEVSGTILTTMAFLYLAAKLVLFASTTLVLKHYSYDSIIRRRGHPAVN